MTTTRRFLLAMTCAIAFTATACAAQPPSLLTKIPAPEIPKDAANPVAADVNADKRDDLLIPAGNALHILLSNGDGTFAAARVSPIDLPMQTNGSLTADFNADGKRDVVARCVNAKELAVMMGR